MKCKNCNAELLDESTFCPYCGTKCEEKPVEVIENVEIKNEVPYQEHEAPCWAKFAKISSILGIISICTCWIPFYGILALEIGAAGIVFGALGKRTKKSEVKAQASSGFSQSLVGTILSFVLFFVWYFIIIMAILNSAY